MTEIKHPTPKFLGNHKGSVEPAFLSEKAAGIWLGISINWLRKCRANGTGPRWNRMGNAIRYPISGLQAYVAETERRFTADKLDSNKAKVPQAEKKSKVR